MKRLTATIALVAVLGLMAGAFACTNCDARTSVNQHINVTVPTVISLILDNNLANSAMTGQTTTLDNWTINLASPDYKASNCYVVPNWVGYTGAGGVSLKDFISYVGGIGNLFPAWSSYVHGSYPAIISSNGKVLTWGDVAKLWPQYALYARGHASARAKGNVVCYNQIAVEKYTNCDQVQFGVAVTAADSNTYDTFGTLFIQDNYQVNGLPGTAGSTGWLSFTSASGTQNYALLLKSIPTGTFIDDVITQMMWLRNSQPGYYPLLTTYTLGSALLGQP